MVALRREEGAPPGRGVSGILRPRVTGCRQECAHSPEPKWRHRCNHPVHTALAAGEMAPTSWSHPLALGLLVAAGALAAPAAREGGEPRPPRSPAGDQRGPAHPARPGAALVWHACCWAPT